MSPSVGNFVTDLVEMAKATERLPLIEAELSRANNAIEDYAKQVQRLELKAIDRNTKIESLHSRIRELEVARDDAELRFLESEEHAGKVLNFLAGIKGYAEAAQLILDPPKPQPEAIPEVVQSVEDVGPDYSKADAEPVPVEESPYYSGSFSNPLPGTIAEGQSEADPIAASETGIQPVSVSSGTVSTTESASTEAEPKPYPYSGKRYYDMPTWISYHDWIAGGGTKDDYNWRPIAKTAW
jgi:hypothetical protein